MRRADRFNAGMPAIVDPSRRRLLGSGLGVSLLGYSSSWLQAAPKVDPDADWVPPDDFLRDLPRQMQALGVPGIGIAVVERGGWRGRAVSGGAMQATMRRWTMPPCSRWPR